MSTEFAEAFVDSDGNVCVAYGDDSDQPINPIVIREAGWIKEDEQEDCSEAHCHDDSCVCVTADVAIELVRRWHNESDHAYAFKFCDQRPCSDMRGYSDLALVR